MKKKIICIVIAILLICTAGLAGLYYYGKWSGTKNLAVNAVNKVMSYRINKKIKDNAGKVEKNNKEGNEVNVIDFSEEDIIDIMHKMANTKIIAEEKWGEIEITQERVKNLQTIVENSDFKNKDELLDMLKRWENKDFSIVDQDHNYLWDKLDGTIGRATGILE